jgi:ornithine cyclodeaminase/alanine dehydrogenase-like protein (mu-crystallin family)
MMEANYLGQVRTGAASGVATKYLARSDAAAMALFGTGFQAEAQLLAVAAISPLQEVRVYSRSEERREDFISRMNQHVSVPLCGVSTPQEAVDGADIITTMTTSSEPVFNGKDISPGTHINAAGSNSAAKAELDHRAVRRADLIFTDDVAQARMESGDLIRAYERNALNWDSVRPLSDLVAGLPVGRSRPDEVTLFESQGIALWDIALAVTVYERARAQNLGQVIEFF